MDSILILLTSLQFTFSWIQIIHSVGLFPPYSFNGNTSQAAGKLTPILVDKQRHYGANILNWRLYDNKYLTDTD